MIYLDLFLGFLLVGLFSFGGAYGAIPLIRDVVITYGWMDEEMLSNMIAVSESTPGPIMVNLATYIGSSKGGLPGAIIATLAVILPSFLIILLVTALLKRLLKNQYVQAAMSGMRPSIIGIILATGAFMVYGNCFTSGGAGSLNLIPILLTVILAGLYFGSRKVSEKGLSPIMLIVISAVGGIIAYGI